MSAPTVPARVFGFVAAEADVCVLLRRGPSKRVLMVRWELATDEFDIGQWLFERVYERYCDLSHDGKLFAYRALDGDWRGETGGVYDAVSRPPYFSALALWANKGNTSGLRWIAPRIKWFEIPPPTKGTIPDKDRHRLRWHDLIYRLRGHGWSTRGFERPPIFVKESLLGSITWFVREEEWPGRYALNDEPLDVQWADVDHRSRLLLAREGRIYVRDQGGERELIDLNPFEFRPLAPPGWAREWP